jgi:ATP-dependent DNA ligase
LSVRLHFIGGAHSTKNDNGPAVFDHACQSGIEGIVSKRLDPNAVWTVKGLAQKSERSRAP